MKNAETGLRFSCVVFDLDGTLVDTFRDIHAATNFALQSLGREPLDLNVVRGFVGHGVNRLIARALQTEDAGLIEQGISLWRQYADAHPADYACFYPGALEFIHFLRQHHVKTAVLSNKVHEVCHLIFEKLNAVQYFDAIWGDRPGFHCKPDPAAMQELLRELHCSADLTLVVGDGEPDMRVARAVGATACGVTWGQNSAEFLRQYGANFIASSFHEIKNIIRKEPF